MRIEKANAILKHPVNKLFPSGYIYIYIYHDTNQTDKTRKKLRRETVVIGELRRKYDC